MDIVLTKNGVKWCLIKISDVQIVLTMHLSNIKLLLWMMYKYNLILHILKQSILVLSTVKKICKTKNFLHDRYIEKSGKNYSKHMFSIIYTAQIIDIGRNR